MFRLLPRHRLGTRPSTASWHSSTKSTWFSGCNQGGGVTSSASLTYTRKIDMDKNITKKKVTGTREWSDVSHNIASGCSHGCLYCYNTAFALEKGLIRDRVEGITERLTPRSIPTKPGIIMFPTAHDISLFYLQSSLTAIEQMMLAGRSVVIVTKAHLECIKAICDKFTAYRDKIVLRVTIGSMDEQECKFWEPGAPPPSERLAALKYAYDLGYTTSVSMEPILVGVTDAVKTFNIVAPYVR